LSGAASIVRGFSGQFSHTAKEISMPTINYYRDAEDTLGEQDVKKISNKIKGKTITLTLRASDLNGDKVKPSFKIAKELETVTGTFGLSCKDKKWDVDGKVSGLGSYTLKYTVTELVKKKDEEGTKSHSIKGTLEIVSADPVAAPEPCPVTYANPKVKSTCEGNKNIKSKIESIAIAGPTEKGHGPVPFLDKALHAHATNTHGVAWKWKSGKMHVVATGKKNNQNKQQQRGGKGPKLKTCEYDWDEG
jgi:hypothetical protein